MGRRPLPEDPAPLLLQLSKGCTVFLQAHLKIVGSKAQQPKRLELKFQVRSPGVNLGKKATSELSRVGATLSIRKATKDILSLSPSESCETTHHMSRTRKTGEPP